MKYCAWYWWMVWIENVTLTKGSVNRKKRCVGQTNEVLHCCCFLHSLLCLICMCCMMMSETCLFGEICILNIKYLWQMKKLMSHLLWMKPTLPFKSIDHFSIIFPDYFCCIHMLILFVCFYWICWISLLPLYTIKIFS